MIKLLLSLSAIIWIANASPQYYGNSNLPTIKLKVDPANVHPTVLWLVSMFSRDRDSTTRDSYNDFQPQDLYNGFQPSEKFDVAKTRRRIQQLGLDTRALTTIGDRSYFFSTSLLNNNDGMIFCNDLNMALISLETQEEQQAIDSYVIQNNMEMQYLTSGIWHNQMWKWSGSGKKVTYTLWAPKNPDTNAKSNLCIHRNPDGWKDNNCFDSKNHVVCEQSC